jgi:hypothetical protein
LITKLFEVEDPGGLETRQQPVYQSR